MNLYFSRSAELIKKLDTIATAEHPSEGRLFLIFGPPASGKTAALEDFGARADLARDVYKCRPETQELVHSYLEAAVKARRKQIFLEGYDGSDLKFNKLLMAFARAGFDVFLSTRDLITETVHKAKLKSIYTTFITLQMGFPEFDRIRYFPSGVARKRLLDGIFTEVNTNI